MPLCALLLHALLVPSATGQCACNTVSVILTGDAASAQSESAGDYVRTSAVHDGQPVYYKGETPGRSLWYVSSMSDWAIGPDHTPRVYQPNISVIYQQVSDMTNMRLIWTY